MEIVPSTTSSFTGSMGLTWTSSTSGTLVASEHEMTMASWVPSTLAAPLIQILMDERENYDWLAQTDRDETTAASRSRGARVAASLASAFGSVSDTGSGSWSPFATRAVTAKT